jgi:mycofactocin radical SAM maturase
MDRCGRELDLAACRALIDELDRMDVFQINFGGGEPFMREDFLDILRYAHEKGITTCVSTNGTMLDEALARSLTEMDLLYLQVSLDGARPDTNDPIRGRGTFAGITRGIELLLAHRFPHLSTNTVVTARNFEEIGEIYELGRRYGVKTRLSRFRPSGNGKKEWDGFRLDRSQLEALSRFLCAHKDIVTGDSFFSITAGERRGLGLNMCGAARMTCSLSPDGDVYPCAFLHDEFFRAGNVTREPLESIWRSAPVFHMLRYIRRESCEICSRFGLCHGGCPAVAYFLTRSLHDPDPECMASFQGDFAEKSTNGVTSYGGTI